MGYHDARSKMFHPIFGKALNPTQARGIFFKKLKSYQDTK